MKLLLKWKAPIPPERDPTQILESFRVALNRAVALDVHLSHGDVSLVKDDLHITLQYEGIRDRFWILHRVQYAIVALCVRAKVPPKTLELVSSETLTTKRNYRKPNRTEPQQVADYNKTKRARWERWQQAYADDSESSKTTT